ncbi:hypothetical protein [Methanobacterium petrolearium]|uniref:hypothetical protein n=1 Tax=Methanobacterium petrolearium TaxID=710190 RepID=UPI001AEA15A0|nr:hypothetical protein [Methanobacterium petrolearium]MBP1945575.1 hypothetical protein [Methanobacterium petrolearium]BDZ71793.1 hypothetical protein GCM10025861_23100 [Methanobacterium petrolearium]
MEKTHQEYMEYYKARLKKYEDNHLYPYSYQSEKALYDAIANSENLDEFGRKVEEGNLAVENAIALVKDQETARKKLYLELKEKIRLHAPLRILDIIDTVKTDLELTDTVSEIEGEVSIEITLDLLTEYIYYDLLALEEIEVFQSAEVPDEWKKEINQDYPQELLNMGQEDWIESVVPNAHKWDPHWQYNFDLIWEERHRRLIPIPDEILKKRIEQFKTYRGI